MELDDAVKLLKRAVKYPENDFGEKRIDLSLVPVEEIPKFQEAMRVSQTSIKEGKISRDEFNRRVGLN